MGLFGNEHGLLGLSKKHLRYWGQFIMAASGVALIGTGILLWTNAQPANSIWVLVPILPMFIGLIIYLAGT
ncbi:MAG: hypothetical protein V1822_00765 [Candidatus Micrarchaeota archaeon]